jgi:hypothetical protein
MNSLSDLPDNMQPFVADRQRRASVIYQGERTRFVFLFLYEYMVLFEELKRLTNQMISFHRKANSSALSRFLHWQ